MTREEFVRALASFPDWSVQRAFDRWCRDHTRRPSPAEICILANRELQPLSDELASRARAEEAAKVSELTPEQMARRREFAHRVMTEMGYSKSAKRDLGPRRETVTEEDKAEMRAMLEGSK